MPEENTRIEHSQILSSGAEDYENLKDITTLVYVLQAVALPIIVTALVGIFINTVKRSDVAGSILESHFRWQIRTFWFSLPWFCIATLLILIPFVGILFGGPILGIVYIWWIYRLVKGWLTLNKGKAMYAPD